MNRKKKKVGIPFRTLIALLAVALLMGGAIGGTMAWLTTSTAPVTNTFTVGDIEIKLDEAPVDADGKKTTGGRVQANSYKIVPGNTYDKDPMVTVIGGNEECYLFIQVTETNRPEDYFEYEYVWENANYSNWTWTEYNADNGKIVYYCIVEANVNDQEIPLLYNNTLKVKDTVIKKGSTPSEGQVVMPATDADAPKIEFKACAVQTANLSIGDAWAQADALLNPTNP